MCFGTVEKEFTDKAKIYATTITWERVPKAGKGNYTYDKKLVEPKMGEEKVNA